MDAAVAGRRRAANALGRGIVVILIGVLLAACVKSAPTPAPVATATPIITPAPASTTWIARSPIATPLQSTVTTLLPIATALPPTATVPTPLATATYLPATATSAAVLYTADFATWFAGTETTPLPIRAGYDPAAQEYRLALTDAARGYVYYRYAPEGRGFADFRLDVEARRVAGPSNGGSYGVVFRAQARGSGDRGVAQYNFYVTADGTFALNLLQANGPATNIVPRTATPAVKTGPTTNYLTVICRGNQITLAINGQTVGTYPAALTGSGAIGLYVANPANPTGPVGMEVAFRNLRVSALPAADKPGLPTMVASTKYTPDTAAAARRNRHPTVARVRRGQ